jgi:methyltransferase-like protein
VIPERPRQRAGLTARTVGGEIILLDRVTNQVHQLNVTASFVWQRCDGEHTGPDIAEALLGAYDVDPLTARDAVVGTLHQLNELGLLGPAQD